MASLVVTKDTSELLFDTSKISYGLVKSGNMSLVETWGRYYKRSAQLDPNDGSSWALSASNIDPMYGFSISGSVSPIVFIAGPGCLSGVTQSGSTKTFLYCNAGAGTRFYCFDLMADNISGSPFLKTFTDAGVCTFNSLQPPLNIITAIQAPGPPAANDIGTYSPIYSGGYNVQRRKAIDAPYYSAAMDSIIDIPISAGVEYAAFLPWSRSALLYNTGTSADIMFSYSVSEGVYGRVGGVSFMFGASAATTQGGIPSPVRTNSFTNVPTDRYPVALVIGTAGLPFPYS